MSEADAAAKSSRSSSSSRASRPSQRISPEPPSSGKGERRVRRKRVRREKKPKVSRGLFFTLVGLGVILAVAATYLLVIYPSGTGPGSGKDVEVTIDASEGPGALAQKLAEAGVVRSPGTFAIYLRLVNAHVAPGLHLLTDDASPHELVRRLERDGSAARAKVTIPEGWTRFDIAKRLQALHVAPARGFVDASADADLMKELALDASSAEGYLFPATYELPLDSDPKDVVRRLVGEFERRFIALEQNHRLGRAQLEGSLGWGRREIVTLASMVEKEAAVDDERAIIASVFLNRLRDPSFKKKLLQCDPTSSYGCLSMKDKIPACAAFAGKPTHAINFDPANTYSTYVHEGLPPGPIANPGMKSLQAVLAPANTKYLYFVVRENRRHTFSETLEEHNTAVKDYRERTAPKAP